MREQTITWYTPEEKPPKENRDILFKEHNGRIHFGHYYMKEFQSSDRSMLAKYIKEWCYIDKM